MKDEDYLSITPFLHRIRDELDAMDDAATLLTMAEYSPVSAINKAITDITKEARRLSRIAGLLSDEVRRRAELLEQDHE